MKKQMRAWQASAHGPFREALDLTSVAIPPVGEKQALIRVKAIGLNFLDLLAIAGQYQEKTPPPFVPGVEAAGEVVACGPRSSLAPGDRVMTVGNGAFAQYMIVDPVAAFPIPEAMSYPEAAAFQLTYQTAHMGLVQRAGLKKGEYLLVGAAAGGVGTAAVQIGRSLGARVIAAAGGPEKLETARTCGAEFLIDYADEGIARRVLEITEGRGADCVFDPVGGDLFDAAMKCIAFEGRILTVGYASGKIPKLSVNRALLKNIDIIGLFWGNYRQFAPQRLEATHRALTALYRAGALRPVVSRTVAFEDLPEGLSALSSRHSHGKIVVIADASST